MINLSVVRPAWHRGSQRSDADPGRRGHGGWVLPQREGKPMRMGGFRQSPLISYRHSVRDLPPNTRAPQPFVRSGSTFHVPEDSADSEV